MLSRLLVVLVVLALAVTPMAAMADAGVKGAGAIAVSPAGVGTFDIGVAQTGNVLQGGFRFSEYATTGTIARPTNVVFSKAVISLQVVGNFARVQAVGYWNNLLCDLTVEARDNGTAGVDWFHVTARPRGPLTVIYDRAGNLIKGDIVVVGSTPVPGFTKGAGAIQVGANVGQFEFKAQMAGTGVVGSAYYVEIVQRSSPIVRQAVRVYLPAVQRLEIVGNTVILSGKGTLNGRPAMVSIKAVDNFTPSGSIMPPVKADEFFLTATPILTDSTEGISYTVGGSLIKGDVVVVPTP